MSWSDKGQRIRVLFLKTNWYLCFGISFLLCVLAALAAAIIKLNEVLNDADKLPIEAVVIKGERRYTADEEIQAALQDLMQRSFFSADVNQVQQTLEAMPWVYQASVRREWPAKLKIYLVEQTPVAHWNGDAWLNIYGEVFDAPAKDGLPSLPSLTGPESQGKRVLTSYKQLGELLRINGFALQNLSLSARHAWYAELKNGVKLELGREDSMARIQRFIHVYPKLAAQDKKIGVVDLRYDTGLAVDWDDAQTESH